MARPVRLVTRWLDYWPPGWDYPVQIDADRYPTDDPETAWAMVLEEVQRRAEET